MLIGRLPETLEGGAIHARPGSSGEALNLRVVYTGLESTHSALVAARDLGRGLRLTITLIVPHVVPYPLPLDQPDVSPEFNQGALRALIATGEAEGRVEILVCRDPDRAVREALRPRSMVVIGGRRHWWPTWERKLARLLQRDGHKIVFIGQR